MKTNFAINDLVLIDLKSRGPVLTVLTENDPILRRFGQVDVVALDVETPQSVLRKKADEVWAVLEGEAQFSLKDLREDSPSYGQQAVLNLDGKAPQALLVPFGVSCRVETQTQARCLRLSTHADATNSEDMVPA